MFDQVAFGKRLQSLRKSRNLTQEELAESLNISREHLSRLERGKYGCSIDLLIEISFVLNASTDYLLMGKTSDNIQDRQQIWSIINQLSAIATKM